MTDVTAARGDAVKIVVGVDGSERARHALAWCAAHAVEFDAELVVVYVIDAAGVVHAPGNVPSPESSTVTAADREAIRDRVTRDWCTPLAQAAVPFRVRVMAGSPANAIIHAARTEDADLVVTGRRGRGGVAEVVLGSTNHTLARRLDRPLLTVP